MTGQITRAKIAIRVPPYLKDWVEAEAARNGCSQNSEIVRALVERRQRLTRADPLSSGRDGAQLEARRS